MEVSPDIDKGWAFVVMVCGTLNLIMTRGLTFTNAIFYITFLDEFQKSTVFTAWSVSLNIFCSLVFCIIAANILLLMIGPRFTVVLGCVLSSIGLLSCSFASNLTMVLVMYGIVTGCGYACSFVACYTMISTYFIRYRIIAYGVMNIGIGVGQLLYPPILKFIMDQYVWRGAFTILAGINLNLLVIAACFMKPRQAIDGQIEQKRQSNKDKVISVLGTLLKNITVFRNPLFPLFCLSMAIYNLGLNGYTTHISNYGRVIGLSESQVMFLPSIVGIGSIAGCLVMGAVTQVSKVPVIAMYMLTVLILGITCIAITFIENVFGFSACCFGAGFSIGTFALAYEVAIQIVGRERLSSSFSFVMVFAASGALAGGPLNALVYEIVEGYLWSYRVIGVILLFGVLLTLPLWIKCKRRPN